MRSEAKPEVHDFLSGVARAIDPGALSLEAEVSMTPTKC
jgi:hypothetical protein